MYATMGAQVGRSSGPSEVVWDIDGNWITFLLTMILHVIMRSRWVTWTLAQITEPYKLTLSYLDLEEDRRTTKEILEVSTGIPTQVMLRMILAEVAVNFRTSRASRSSSQQGHCRIRLREYMQTSLARVHTCAGYVKSAARQKIWYKDAAFRR